MRKLALPIAAFLLLSGFTLTWDNPPESDLATIQIYQSQQSGVFGTPLATIPATSPGASQSYVATSPERGTYFWVVKACDTAGNCSGPSNEATTTFLDRTAPGVPGSLRVTQ